MIICMGHIRFGDGVIEQLQAAMAKQVLLTRAEDGCEHYSYAIDVLDSNLLLISERWRDEAAMAQHIETATSSEFAKSIQPLIKEISVKAYENGTVRTVIGT
jgi:quinol monooxygenase YgiN